MYSPDKPMDHYITVDAKHVFWNHRGQLQMKANYQAFGEEYIKVEDDCIGISVGAPEYKMPWEHNLVGNPDDPFESKAIILTPQYIKDGKAYIDFKWMEDCTVKDPEFENAINTYFEEVSRYPFIPNRHHQLAAIFLSHSAQFPPD